MDHDQRAGRARLLERPDQGEIIDPKHALVGHEEFEAGDALIRQAAQLRLDRIGHLADDDMKSVVDGRLAARVLVPDAERVGEALAEGLLTEIDDGRGAATPPRACPMRNRRRCAC